MAKTILITGATAGIGLETAKALAVKGHKLLLQGRSAEKLAAEQSQVKALPGAAGPSSYMADLSDLSATETLAADIRADFSHLDVLINNAGIFKTAKTRTDNDQDIRFVVNTLAPFVLARDLLPIMTKNSRVVNLSSAAQAPVDLTALSGQTVLSNDFDAYAQSKLAITMWTAHLAKNSGPDAPLYSAVNPGSYLATKMVTEGFSMAGNDVNQGVDILLRAALSDEFEGRSGEYFDNDSGRFAPMHPAGQDATDQAALMAAIKTLT